MQSTLTEKVLQNFRQRHLDASIPALLAQLHELQQEDEEMTTLLLTHHEPKNLKQLLCRDIVALLLTQVVRWLGGGVHGDFVRALFSGKSWSALCVHFDTCAQLETFQTMGPIILRQLLGVTAENLQLHLPASLETGQLTWHSMTIDIILKYGNLGRLATWGLRLGLNLQGVHYYCPHWIPENIWPLDDVLHALRTGRDIRVSAPYWHHLAPLDDPVDVTQFDGYHML